MVRVDEPEPGIIRLTLNRPDRLNALTPALLDRFTEALGTAARSESARVVILSGAGRAFCSGFDLGEIAETGTQGLPELLTHQEGWARAVERVVELPIPVIAAVQGPAVGAGLSLAMAADLRVATPSARFGAAFVRIGLSGADLGLSWSLPRVIGMGAAAELMLTGRGIDGHEAVRLGMVNKLCEGAELAPTALALAREIAANSPFGVRLTKQALRSGVDAPSLRAAVDNENRNQILASRTADMAEALRAREQRREPVYENR
ncbi:enoyl-CoA hydratase/isomerase family protein [Amycolatopsis acidicola]|uniref:Enoyl-CoA hydratase/isomerase family protein n=1 Tax=Amycolatopsis acidicola TaxID=2596893 RepID=A0A5N0VKX6_9PSEU|nr:enoyl-CoA hydratase/isomerase family protein [Amycolatopsis acidicola]KAA9165994.1 enoyl-CoA hydratase/isomerase family protein [Amycolatopsis acidicola]